MRGDSTSESVGLVDHGLHLLVRKIHPGVQSSVLQEIPAISVELDPIGAIFHLLAYRPANIVGAINNLYSFGHFQFPRIAEQRIHSGSRKRSRGDEHVWAGYDTAVYSCLHIHIGVHRSLSLEIPHDRETI